MTGPRLTTLLHAYQAERADDTQAVTTFFGLLTAAIGLMTLIGFALVYREDIPSWLIAVAPVAPIPFVAFGALIAHIAQIRGRVIDRYETEIRTLTRAADPGSGLAPYGHTVLDRVVWEAPFSRIVMAVSFVSYFFGYVAVVVQCFRYSRNEEFLLALATLIFASVVMLVLIGLFVVALFPYRALRRGLALVAAESARPPLGRDAAKP